MTILSSIRLLLITLLIVFVPVLGKAAVPTWQIVPNESTLTFTATQNGAPASGNFKHFSGDISFDPAQLADSHVRIVVDLNSVTTSYREVGETLKTADWFNVKLFPQAVFTANHFTKTADNTYKTDGNLTIRDKTVPVTLTFTLADYSKAKAHVKGTTTLKRTAFGVGQGDWAKTDTVKDDVQINFNLIATHQ